jgi:short-subunit dehydrogenase involved in D-alanine esterification of teichoic acids
VVTGGSSGIGLAAAQGLSSAGARVAIAGRDEARLARGAAAIEGDVVTVAADLSSQAGAAA